MAGERGLVNSKLIIDDNGQVLKSQISTADVEMVVAHRGLSRWQVARRRMPCESVAMDTPPVSARWGSIRFGTGTPPPSIGDPARC